MVCNRKQTSILGFFKGSTLHCNDDKNGGKLVVEIRNHDTKRRKSTSDRNIKKEYEMNDIDAAPFAHATQILASTSSTDVNDHISTPLQSSGTQNHSDFTSIKINEIDHRSRINVTTKKKRNAPPEQRYLDFGQASFGCRTICPVCNFLFVHGVEEDEVRHRQICSNYTTGVSFLLSKNVRVVEEIATTNSTTECIVEIRPSDPLQQKRKAMQVKAIVDQELGFYCSPSKSPSLNKKTVYLYLKNKRVLGFCSVETISKAFHLCKLPEGGENDLNDSSNTRESKTLGKLEEDKTKTTSSTSISQAQNHCYHRSKDPQNALMGIHQLWCHRSNRRSGAASKLLNVARSKFVYGMSIPLDMIAFSSPTVDGIMFACRYLESDTPLVYECY